MTRIVHAHAPLYEGPRPSNEVAVVYSNQAMLADPSRYGAFIRLCRSLAALNLQYDVLYAGDDRFAPRPLDARALAEYPCVLLPGANALTSQQVEAIRSVLGPDRVVAAFGQVDQALEASPHLWRVPEPGTQELAALLPEVNRTVRRVSEPQVRVTAYFRSQVPALIVHLLNDVYDAATDRVKSRSGISIELRIPAAFDPAWTLMLLAPGQAPATLAYTREDGTVRFEVPRLDLYAAAVFAAWERPPAESTPAR